MILLLHMHRFLRDAFKKGNFDVYGELKCHMTVLTIPWSQQLGQIVSAFEHICRRRLWMFWNWTSVNFFIKHRRFKNDNFDVYGVFKCRMSVLTLCWTWSLGQFVSAFEHMCCRRIWLLCNWTSMDFFMINRSFEKRRDLLFNFELESCHRIK